MANEMLQRTDLTLYVVAGLPKNFVKKLKGLVESETDNGDVLQVDPEMTDWVVARLRGEKRRSHEQTPASAALWRAYSALSAARYHLQDRPEEAQIRDLRRTVEELWRDVSPLFAVVAEEGKEEGTGTGSEGEAAPETAGDSGSKGQAEAAGQQKTESK